MDDAAIGTARLWRWLVRPNEADEPEHHHAANANRLAPRELPVAAE
jgi:hypothetical protein